MKIDKDLITKRGDGNMKIVFTKDQPDASIGISGMRRYGYGWDGMLPINNKEIVKDIFDTCDITVYALYSDGTEAEVDSKAAISSHDGLFGVDKTDWNNLVDAMEYEENIEKAEEFYDKYSDYIDTEPEMDI